MDAKQNIKQKQIKKKVHLTLEQVTRKRDLKHLPKSNTNKKSGAFWEINRGFYGWKLLGIKSNFQP